MIFKICTHWDIWKLFDYWLHRFSLSFFIKNIKFQNFCIITEGGKKVPYYQSLKKCCSIKKYVSILNFPNLELLKISAKFCIRKYFNVETLFLLQLKNFLSTLFLENYKEVLSFFYIFFFITKNFFFNFHKNSYIIKFLNFWILVPFEE